MCPKIKKTHIGYTLLFFITVRYKEMNSTNTPICVNTYGIKICTNNLLSINKVMVRDYVVQLAGTNRLPHTKCFSLCHGEGDHFAVLPTPDLIPEMAPVFDYLDSHPTDIRCESLVGNGSTSTISLLRGGLPEHLHDITLRVLRHLED